MDPLDPSSTLLPEVGWPNPNPKDPDLTNRKGANPVDPVNLDPDPILPIENAPRDYNYKDRSLRNAALQLCVKITQRRNLDIFLCLYQFFGWLCERTLMHAYILLL